MESNFKRADLRNVKNLGDANYYETIVTEEEKKIIENALERRKVFLERRLGNYLCY